MELVEESPYRFRIDRHDPMRVPGVVFASRSLLPDAGADKSLDQVANVATLPGIVGASYAMPDVHWGYGFPIGGVAATDIEEGGVVSPGGVGFDISCGVRLLAADLDRAGLRPRLDALMDGLGEATPRGMGKGAVWHLTDRAELDAVLRGGSRHAVERGFGVQHDLDRCEDYGAVDDANPAQVSERAVERGARQVGSLGSGNHFLEVQVVEDVYDEAAASAFGLRAGQVCVMIHCGSRGLGHQICTDYVHEMEKVMRGYGIHVPDRQLACAPVSSHEGRAYLGAMAAAANYARANRQLLHHAARQVFHRVTGSDLDLVYDISHNLAKIETHQVDGARRRLCVHRKGATRALPPGHADLPDDLRGVGQPVLIPGSMGTGSYVLTGVPGAPAWASTCHGAGRVQSRKQATKAVRGHDPRRELEAQDIAVRGASRRGLAEEMPAAYKDITAVVAAAEGAGLCRRVARLVPIGVVKG
ncbi:MULTISPECIES: RtcB family protein [Micromonospora]|uniref:tRNA-splicing ligase RtcB n=1 Tax=Micromonospora sicca TaxID=2202420 RepID=A0A317DSK0_9ACTN|nr:MULTISPECIES: RtcB family protein [unclassified Micromonospora]MBM0226980.1 RtcB family protein [Micromonospora sp. ATA51]PWR16816.1 RNA-splicing ligase RtcB [Micromonospora sp. 4G51]